MLREQDHEPFLHRGTDLAAAESDGLDAAQDQIGQRAIGGGCAADAVLRGGRRD